MLSNAKYGGRGILPVFHVVQAGTLQGFVAVNPRWASFIAGDYLSASAFVETAQRIPGHIRFEAQPGDLDLRGFEIARAQLFQTAAKLCVTFSIKSLRFNAACIQKFEDSRQVELLVHPQERLMAVRPAQDNLRHTIRWMKSCTSSFIGMWNTSTAYKGHSGKKKMRASSCLTYARQRF